jgi:hypothetical protein
MKTARKNRKSVPVAENVGNHSPQLQLAPKGDKSLELFLQSASHELSNVLGTVLGELDYGLSNPNPTVKARAMTIALQASERARSLARNLCYFAIHSTSQPETYSLTQLVSDTVELSQSEFLHRRIRPQVTVETNVVAHGNASAIQQGLLNIFRRALSTMPQGGTLSVTLARKNGNIEIVCRDNGVGIPNQRLESLLFPPFSATTSDQKLDPNELELFITRMLAEKEGAKFEVKSSVGIGTTYTLRLPTDEKLAKRDIVEHRRFRRVNAVLPVEISFNGFAPFHSEMETLSVGGCFARITDAQAKLPPNESVGSLRIHYYQDQVLDIHRCRIASQNTKDGKLGLGIEFLEVDPKAEKILRAIVHSHGFAINR